MENNNVLTTEEKLSYTLSSIYDGAGFARFRMSKFEEYSLYLENKNFLSCENVITFNDVDGKLLALKPDVTLSIVKNAGDKTCGVKKLYYNENVYRPDKSNGKFKEIGQIGLEAIGSIDDYITLEVVALAVKSLAEIDENFVLDISNVSFVTSFLGALKLSEENCKNIIACIGGKNPDELMKIAEVANLGADDLAVLKKIITANGDFAETLKTAKNLAVNVGMKKAVAELDTLYLALKELELADKIRLDFSIINDVNYYNDVVFQGYVQKVPRAVLSGGRYDSLVQKFNKKAQAIGFAVYLNEVAAYYSTPRENDVDVIVLYDKSANIVNLFDTMRKLKDDGASVTALTAVPENVRYGKLLRYDNGTLAEVENA